MAKNPLSTYQKNQVEGLGQRELVVMCYKGAIKYLDDARKNYLAGELDAFSDLIEKGHRVILHLYTTLDMEKGGELAQRLAELYVYAINQIYLVNATKNVRNLDNVISILSTLKEGWESIGSGQAGVLSERKTAAANIPTQILSTQA